MGVIYQHLLDGRSTRALAGVSLDGGPATHLDAGLGLITWLNKGRLSLKVLQQSEANDYLVHPAYTSLNP